MRLLFLNHNVAWSGGTYYRAWHLGRELARRGNTVTLLSISARARFGFKEYMEEGVRIVETPDWLWGRGRTGWDGWDTLRRIQFVRREQWDLVHAFDSRPAVIFPALAVSRGAPPLVMDWADWWGRGGTQDERTTGLAVRIALGPVETWLEETFRTRAQASTVASSALFQRAVGLGVRPETILLLPGGSDVRGVKPRSQSEARRALGLPEQIPVLGHLGAMNSSDAELLFAAFSLVREELPDCRLFLIGRHYIKTMRQNGVIETGYVSRDALLEYMAACDLMLLPLKDTVANRGRWPSKFNDYIAAGRPVVATRVGDVGAVFDRYAVGAATPDNPESFASGIVALLADRQQGTELGRCAREVAERVFSWDLLADRLVEHYKSL